MNTATINTTTNVTPFTQNLKQQQQQKQQTAKEAIAANVQALIEQLEQGHSRRPHRLPHGDGKIPQLQLWEHPGDRTAKAGRYSALRGCMRGTSLAARSRRESAASAFSLRSLASSARRMQRPRRTSAPRIKPSWSASVLPMSSMSARPKARSFPNCPSASAAMSAIPRTADRFHHRSGHRA